MNPVNLVVKEFDKALYVSGSTIYDHMFIQIMIRNLGNVCDLPCIHGEPARAVRLHKQTSHFRQPFRTTIICVYIYNHKLRPERHLANTWVHTSG